MEREHIRKGDIGLTRRRDTHGVGTHMERKYTWRKDIHGEGTNIE